MAITARNSRASSYFERIARPLSHLLSAAIAAQSRRDLDSQACCLLAQSGGRLTDSVEREIARRHLGL
jgi:hypothetical protein